MQNLVKIHQSFSKILSGNENVTDGQTDGQPENSIPPCPHTVMNGQKWTVNNPKLDVVNINFDLLASFIQDSADKHIPSKTSRSVSSIPWITHEIRRKIGRKNKTHAKAKKTGSSKLGQNLKL